MIALERAHRRAARRYRLEDAVEKGYVPRGYDPSMWKLIMTTDCPYCKRKAGHFCMTKDDTVLSPSRSHRKRMDEYWSHQRVL
jgi:hypothetical protein